MAVKVQIYGERCSGTNYLENLLELNFNVQIIWNYGWKHFFGFADLSGSDDVLFIGIVRNLDDWANSLYRMRHHLPTAVTKDVSTFLTSEFYSIDKGQGNREIMEDRNIETGARYRNIFELRLVKNRFLVDTMPTLVKNYCLITHDDLIDKFQETMCKLQSHGLMLRSEGSEGSDPSEGFRNITYYKKSKDKPYVKQANLFSINTNILPEALLRYENRLFSKRRNG